MNRKRRKAVKMARKHKTGIFAVSTNIWWKSVRDVTPMDWEAIDRCFREMYTSRT
jgi:hypothetical protein